LRKLKTTPERLELLIDWINSDYPWPHLYAGDQKGSIDRRVSVFLSSFDGSEEAGFVRAEVLSLAESRLDGLHLDENELTDLLMGLRLLLDRGFRPERGYPGTFEDDDTSYPDIRPLSSLMFGIERQAKFGTSGRERRRLKDQHGVYIRSVGGNRVDLVLYLVMHLLTMPGAIALGRCSAPAPNSFTERCGRFVVATGQGPARRFCSDACRQRNHARPLDQDRPNTRRGQ